jgi:hypothetical protein
LAADAHDCIMVWIYLESTEYKGVARDRAPTTGQLASDCRRNLENGPSRASSSRRVLRRQGAAKHKLR